MRSYQIIIFTAFVCSVSFLTAQNVGDEDVEVVSDYNPILADAVKENFTPLIPEGSTKPEPQTYNVPIDFFQIPYQPVKVKPIRLPDEKPEELENVYVKVGFGTQLTPLAEAYIGSKRSEKMNYGFYGKYISQNGNLENQNYSNLKVGGTGKFFIDKKYVLPINAYYASNTFYYYGYNNDDTTFEKNDVKQTFHNYGFDLGFKNTADNPLDLDFGINGGLKGINDINKYNEINPFLNGFAEKELPNGHKAGASVSYDYYAYTGAGSDYDYITGIKPYYKIMNDEWSLTAGIEAKVDKDSKSYILPDAIFSYDLIGDKFVFVAGWKGVLQVNNFENIVAENPFVNDTLNFRNSEIQEKFIGLRGSTNGNFSFTVKGYQKTAKDLPFYINDSSDMKRFNIVYDDASIWGGNIELSYFNSDKFNFTGSVNVFKFSELTKLDQPYHRPSLEWTLSGMYRFNSKMLMNADVFGVGKSFALLADGTDEEIKGTTDLNISAVYEYSKYFNIFLNLNNMANFKYQRYYNYPSYGAQIMGGLSFTF